MRSPYMTSALAAAVAVAVAAEEVVAERMERFIRRRRGSFGGEV